MQMFPEDSLHVSVSQLKTWLRCPRQYELKYVRGVEPERTSRALVFGRAFHSALSLYYSSLRDTGAGVPREALVEEFRLAWENEVASGPRLGNEDDSQVDPFVLADAMFRVFEDGRGTVEERVLAVEQAFTATLWDPVTGEVLDEKLVGVMDLVLEQDGRAVVVEHKTSARRYSADQLRHDVQPTAYRLAMRELGHEDAGLLFQVFTKTKQPQLQREPLERTAADEEELLHTVVGVLRAVDAGVFFPLRGWQCRSCPYMNACTARGRR